MKRTALTLLLGLAGALFAHVGWYNAHRPSIGADLDAQLAWMKQDLNLNEQQISRIKDLHEQESPRLLALAKQVADIQRKFAVFERERQSVGQVDFLAFAHSMEAWRQLDRDCAASTRSLVTEAANVMTPEQRQQYLNLLTPALNKSGVGSL